MFFIQLGALLVIVMLGLSGALAMEYNRPRLASALCWTAFAIGVVVIVFTF